MHQYQRRDIPDEVTNPSVHHPDFAEFSDAYHPNTKVLDTYFSNLERSQGLMTWYLEKKFPNWDRAHEHVQLFKAYGVTGRNISNFLGKAKDGNPYGCPTIRFTKDHLKMSRSRWEAGWRPDGEDEAPNVPATVPQEDMMMTMTDWTPSLQQHPQAQQQIATPGYDTQPQYQPQHYQQSGHSANFQQPSSHYSHDATSSEVPQYASTMTQYGQHYQPASNSMVPSDTGNMGLPGGYAVSTQQQPSGNHSHVATSTTCPGPQCVCFNCALQYHLDGCDCPGCQQIMSTPTSTFSPSSQSDFSGL